jgi:hypothetical protein
MTQKIRSLCQELAYDLALWIDYDDTPSNLPFEYSKTRKLLERAHLELAKTELHPSDQDESQLKQLENDMRFLGERYSLIEQKIAMINLKLEAQKADIDRIWDKVDQIVETEKIQVSISMVEEVDLAIARAPMSIEVTDAFAAKAAIRAMAKSLRALNPGWAQESTTKAFADFIEEQAGE